MVYSNISRCGRPFTALLVIFVVIAFMPLFGEQAYGAAPKKPKSSTAAKSSPKTKSTSKGKSSTKPTKPVPPVIKNLSADTTIAQEGIPVKKKKKHYRKVLLRWEAPKKGTRYVVYGKWNTRSTHYRTEKIEKTVKKNGKKKKVTVKKKVKYYTWAMKIHELATVKGCRATVLAKNNKTCTLFVVPWNDTIKGESCTVTTYKGNRNATDITALSFTSSIPERSTGTISAVSNSSENSSVRYTSSNPSVGDVTAGGLIEAKKIGTFHVIATAHNGFRKQFKVEVTRMYPSKITISGKKKRNLSSGKKLTLKATAEDGTDRTLYWKSSNKKIATVTSGGVVSAVASGTATITVYGGHFSDTKSAVAKVKVNVLGSADLIASWAEKIAKDDRFGYSMRTRRGKLDRFCYFCHGTKVSKDYDCASFVAAAVAHGYGSPAMKKYCKSSGGCTTLYKTLKKNGWKDLGRIKNTKKLKRGDILVNPSRHVEIFTGKKNKLGQYLNVGAHDNYDGRTGDSTGREISIAPTLWFNTPWHHYTHVMRLKE